MTQILKKNKGQSLAEILIAITVGALILGSAAAALVFTVRSNAQNRATQSASSLAQELLDKVRSKTEGNWPAFYNLDKSGSIEYPYYLDSTLNFVEDSEATPQLNINNVQYTRYFIVENVNRKVCGSGKIIEDLETGCTFDQTGILQDPSTQKITAKVTWQQGGDTAEVSVSEYLTRSKNEVNQFADWSGSSDVEGPITKPSKDYFGQSDLDTTTPGSIQLASGKSSGWLVSSTFDTGRTDGAAFNSIMWDGDLGVVGNAVKFQFASSNQTTGKNEGATGPIDAAYRYAWNSVIGWLDFYGAPGGPATVTTAKMTRWATSSGGDFALDCATTPGGDICAISNFYVSNATGSLAGWAWNDAYGWVSFCGNATDGSVWNLTTLTWDCPASPTYQVTINQTDGEFHGWAWNDIVGWISFNCAEAGVGVCDISNYKVKVAGFGSDTWNYIGPDGYPSSFYVSTGPDVPAQIVTSHHNNKKYYRYKVYLEGDASLIVDDVIVNWSP